MRKFILTCMVALLSMAPAFAQNLPSGPFNVTATGANTKQTIADITARILAPEDFGAVGNGSTDDSTALNGCVTAAAASHGICMLSAKQYYIASSVNVPAYAALRGGTDPGSDSQSPSWNANVLRPMIIEGSGTTINVAGELSNTAVVRSGVSLNPVNAQAVVTNIALYAGTGITLTGSAVVEHVAIIGMAQAITTNGQDNWRLRHIRGDNLAGLLITQTHDFSWADDIEWMPMLNPSTCCAQLTSIVTGTANNGSGAVRLAVSNASQFVTGNTLVVYGVTGTTGANGRFTATVIDGSHLDLVGSTYNAAWVSGGTVFLNSTEKPGPAYSVNNSEAPLLTQISSYGYDTGLYLGANAGWVKVMGYSQDNYAYPDPGLISIDVESNAYGSSISVNYMGGWTPIKLNTTSDKPTIIEGGNIYGENQSFPAQPAVNLIQGTLILANSDCRSMPFYVANSATLFLTNSNCANSTWFSGSNFSNVYMTNTQFGDATGNTVRGPQIHLQVPNGTSWQNALDVTLSNVTANVPTAVVTGTQSNPALFTVSGSNLAGDQGGEIKLVNSFSGAVAPNKFLGIAATDGGFFINNSTFQYPLLRLGETGNVWTTGWYPVTFTSYGDSPSGAGNAWLMQANGAQTGGTNLAGGNLTLAAGKATGNGISSLLFQAAGGGASGTADQNPATVATFSAASAAFATPIKNSTYTVSTLPACVSGLRNSFAAVSDAVSGASPLVGGGSFSVSVVCNRGVWAPLGEGQTFAVTDYGAKCDGKIIYGGVTVTSGSKVISTPAYSFTSADVGATITLSVAPFNSYTSGALTSFTDTIASVSGGNATLTNNATFSSSASGARWYHTVDTTAIQAALTAASGSAPGGGTVAFPAGVCVTGSLTFYSNENIVGASFGGSVIMLASGTNQSMFVSNNFASLTGSDSTGGVHDWAIQNLQLDGNRGANTGSGIGTAGAVGNLIKVYGYEFTMDNVLLVNFPADGIYTEWSSSAGSPVDSNGNYGPAGLEAHVHDIKCAYGAGWCWTFGGPHDSLVSHLTTLSNGTGGFNMLGTGAAASPVSLDHYHGYQEPTDLSLYTNVYCEKCFSEGVSQLNGFGYILTDSLFNTLTLGHAGGDPIYNIYSAQTIVTTLNNQAGTGFQDLWVNGVVGSVSGNAYNPSQVINSRGLLSNLGASFQLTNSASYPAIFAQSAGSSFTLTNTGATQYTNVGGVNTFSGSLGAASFFSTTRCASGASPAVCSAAPLGSVAVPTGTNPTLVVNTSAVTANSQILLSVDETRGSALSVTCNTTLTTLPVPVVTARSAGASFTIQLNATVATNPVCVNYMVIN